MKLQSCLSNLSRMSCHAAKYSLVQSHDMPLSIHMFFSFFLSCCPVSSLGFLSLLEVFRFHVNF